MNYIDYKNIMFDIRSFFEYWYACSKEDISYINITKKEQSGLVEKNHKLTLERTLKGFDIRITISKILFNMIVCTDYSDSEDFTYDDLNFEYVTQLKLEEFLIRQYPNWDTLEINIEIEVK